MWNWIKRLFGWNDKVEVTIIDEAAEVTPEQWNEPVRKERKQMKSRPRSKT